MKKLRLGEKALERIILICGILRWEEFSALGIGMSLKMSSSAAYRPTTDYGNMSS